MRDAMYRREGNVFDGWTIVLGLFGLGNVANGLWMLVDPVTWYHTLPARVPDFGPLNEHFVRDIDCIYLLLGSALVAGAFQPSLRVPTCGPPQRSRCSTPSCTSSTPRGAS